MHGLCLSEISDIFVLEFFIYKWGYIKCTIYTCMKMSSCNTVAQWCAPFVDPDCYIIRSSIEKLIFFQPNSSTKFRMMMQTRFHLMKRQCN